MEQTDLIVLYDIASGPPVQPYAPNPWKSRYALGFKGVNYRTEWVELPDVTKTRKKLGVAPNRLHPDGSDFYTLPIIQDFSNNGEIVGDSFDIAVYLDRVYPDSPKLLPADSLGLYRAFNMHVDMIFTNHILLMASNMPLNPERAQESIQEFERRYPGMKWENNKLEGQARTDMFTSFRKSLGELAKTFKYRKGPFLDGDLATYADLIVGGWLQMTMRTVSKAEWDEICTWHEGLWGTLHQGLAKYATIK